MTLCPYTWLAPFQILVSKVDMEHGHCLNIWGSFSFKMLRMEGELTYIISVGETNHLLSP